MPIDYGDYHPKWTLIVRLIRKRSGNKCEKCGVPNGKVIHRKGDVWELADEHYQGWSVSDLKNWNEIISTGGYKNRFVRIVLTTAHIDQDKNNNRFNNLGHWCQKCHLGHDRNQHSRNRKYGRNHKRDQYNLYK